VGNPKRPSTEKQIYKNAPARTWGSGTGGRRKTLGVQGCGVKDYQEITPTLEYLPCHLLVKRFFVNSDLSKIGLL